MTVGRVLPAGRRKDRTTVVDVTHLGRAGGLDGPVGGCNKPGVARLRPAILNGACCASPAGFAAQPAPGRAAVGGSEASGGPCSFGFGAPALPALGWVAAASATVGSALRDWCTGASGLDKRQFELRLISDDTAPGSTLRCRAHRDELIALEQEMAASSSFASGTAPSSFHDLIDLCHAFTFPGERRQAALFPGLSIEWAALGVFT